MMIWTPRKLDSSIRPDSRVCIYGNHKELTRNLKASLTVNHSKGESFEILKHQGRTGWIKRSDLLKGFNHIRVNYTPCHLHVGEVTLQKFDWLIMSTDTWLIHALACNFPILFNRKYTETFLKLSTKTFNPRSNWFYFRIESAIRRTRQPGRHFFPNRIN